LHEVLFSAIANLERGRGFSDEIPLDGIKDFLLLQHPIALGTAVHATPLIPALREAVPGCRIAVAASGFGLNVFRNHPGVDWLIETPDPLRDWWGAARVLRRKNPFRGGRFVVITTRGSDRTKVCLQSLFLGSSARVGFTEVPQLYRTAVDYDPARSMIANNLSILQVLGHRSRHFEPQMFFSTVDMNYAKGMLAESGVEAGQMIAVFVTQTSLTQRKSWRRERFQAAAKFLIDRYKAHVLFVGTESEREAIEGVRQSLPDGTSNLAGRTSLAQMTALLSLCDVGLTLDTGTMHIGRTVQLPMVIVAPAWSPPMQWLPLGDSRYRILVGGRLETCPPEYVIDEVSVDQVTGALQELIEGFPPGQRGQPE
jgi:ADP-heptose:LPS heptosyltransferase